MVSVPVPLGKNGIRFFKAANRSLRVEWTFQQGLRVPLAPVRWIGEIAAVHMNCAGRNSYDSRVALVQKSASRTRGKNQECCGLVSRHTSVSP